MVFKRPKAGTTAAAEPNAAAAFYALLADRARTEKDAAKAEKMEQERKNYEAVVTARAQAERDAAKAQAQAAAQKAAEADYARAVRAAQHAADLQAKEAAVEQERAKRLYADQIDAAKRAADQERGRAEELERMIKKLRAEQEEILRRMKELEGKRGARVPAGGDPRGAGESLAVPLKHVKAREAAQLLARQFAAEDFGVRSDDSTNTLYIQGPPEVLAKLKDAIAKMVDVPPASRNAGPERPATTRVPLAYVDGPTAAKDLGRLMPGAKIIAEVRPDSIVLAGPPEQIEAARQQLQKQIDVKRTDPAADKPETLVLKPKHAIARDLWDVLSKVYEGRAKLTTDPGSNSLIVVAPPAVQAEVKKLVDAFDVERGKP